jgi:hypothetical protein
MRRIIAVTVAGVLSVGVAHADVKTEERAQVKFAGALGRMMNMFGGRAAREGVVTTVAVKGDRKATRTDQRGQIIDLAEEKVYDIDYRDKSYTVTTFAELRRQMEEARRRAAEQAKNSGTPAPAPSDARQKEFEVDFSLKESGQRKTVNGFDAREVVMTIAVREKGKTLEEGGGLVMTGNSWVAPTIAGVSEVAVFDRRYAEKLALATMIDAKQMAQVMAMYPMMADAMKRLQAENVNLDGTLVMTVVNVEAVASAEQAAQAKAEPAKDEPAPRGIGGLAGALGGRLGRRVAGGGQEPAASATPGRASVMTMEHQLMKVTASAADADVQIPAGFKQK